MAKNQISKPRIFIVLIAIITILAVFLAIRGDRPISVENLSVSPTPVDVVTAEYRCAQGRSLTAEFINSSTRSVKLSLDDGRTLELLSLVSASGARYADSDENIVFWNVGDTANLEENGLTTYENCEAF